MVMTDTPVWSPSIFVSFTCRVSCASTSRDDVDIKRIPAVADTDRNMKRDVVEPHNILGP